MRPEDRARLRHMLGAARDAIHFAANRSRGDLGADRMPTFSLLKAIEIIGEAASHVSEDARALAPDIPWREIVNMRHRLIHAYNDVNLDVVWQTVTEDLPPLISAMERLLSV